MNEAIHSGFALAALTSDVGIATVRPMPERDEPEPARVSVAVHGIGDHARRTVLPAIMACPFLELSGISTRNEDVRREQARKWNCQGWPTIDDLLNRMASDVVFVTTPIGQHFDDGLQVLGANRHLWCEKALTNSVAQAQALASAAETAGLALCVSYAPAYHPLYHEVRRIVQGGEIGRPRVMRAAFGFPHTARTDSKYDPVLGGGALLDVGYYPLLLGAFLFDEMPSLDEACIDVDAGFDVDTRGRCRLLTASGVEIHCEWGYGREYVNQLEIVGEAGRITVSPIFSKPPNRTPTLTIEKDGVSDRREFPHSNQFAAMMRAFALAINEPASQDKHRQFAVDAQRLLDDVRAHGAA